MVPPVGSPAGGSFRRSGGGDAVGPVHFDGDALAGCGPAPDVDRAVALHDHVAAEDAGQVDLGGCAHRGHSEKKQGFAEGHAFIYTPGLSGDRFLANGPTRLSENDRYETVPHTGGYCHLARFVFYLGIL